jgi:hypothetical protein
MTFLEPAPYTTVLVLHKDALFHYKCLSEHRKEGMLVFYLT